MHFLFTSPDFPHNPPRNIYATKPFDNDKQIALIALYYGTIYYSIDPDGEMKPLQEVFEETFANAVRIVKEPIQIKFSPMYRPSQGLQNRSK